MGKRKNWNYWPINVLSFWANVFVKLYIWRRKVRKRFR